MKFREKAENLAELLSITIADETDEFVSEDLSEQILALAEEAIRIHLDLESDDEFANEDDALDFRPDMDSFSEED